jgi:rhomboid protease GluP
MDPHGPLPAKPFLRPASERALAFSRWAPATILLVVAQAMVFFVAERGGSTEDVGTLLLFGATSRAEIHDGEWWRLGTSMFLHIGVAHFLWNAFAGIPLCVSLERRIGSIRFLIAYLVCGFGASAVSVAWHDVIAAGSSGALFGVAVIGIGLRVKERGGLEAFWADPKERRRAKWLSFWLVGGFTGVISMDAPAHVGGALVGLAIGALVIQPFANWTRLLRGWAVCAVAGLALLTVLASRAAWTGNEAPREQAESLRGLALAYREKGGGARGQRRWEKWSRAACNAGSAGACNDLGYAYETGSGLATDIAAAVSFYRRSCELGEPAGCYNEARGLGPDQHERAVALFERACEGKVGAGCMQLGAALMDTRFGAVDVRGPMGLRVSEAYSKAAAMGVDEARIAHQHVEYLRAPDAATRATLLQTLDEACSAGKQESCRVALTVRQDAE